MLEKWLNSCFLFLFFFFFFSTIKCGCPVLVKVVSEKCLTGGQFVYRLTKIILEHNHDVSESVRDIDIFNIKTNSS